MKVHRWLVAAAILVAGSQVVGQSARTLTLEAIYDPASRVNFTGAPLPDVEWLDDNRYIVAQRTSRGAEWVKVDAVSGKSTPLFDTDRLEAAIATLPNAGRAEARLLARSGDLTLDPTRTAALIEIADDLYIYSFEKNALTRLTSKPGAEQEPTFSPDGHQVAFVRANNLFVVDIATTNEQALTSDGNPQTLNGRLDWLYQEEIYGRGHFRAFWWSPDSSKVAFLRLDERPVPEYTVVDHLPYRQSLEVTDYPKAGDPNPIVTLGIAPAAGGETHWVNLDTYRGVDTLIVNVGWTPDSRSVVHQIQNREQTWLDLNLADAATGTARRLLRETTPAWVNENGNPIWLRDGSFLWFSEQSGFKQLYRVTPDGRDRQPVTRGRWDVRRFYGVDESSGTLYFAAGAREHVSTDIYRIRLDGSDMTRVSQSDGTHNATFSPGFKYYVDERSTVTTPPQQRLHESNGREVRVLESNEVRALSAYGFSTPEFVQVKARDGFVMDAMLIKPPDFVPSRRYPVYQLTYAGPGTAQVRNEWGGSQYIFHQLLAQHGVIVWILDNRSAGGRGAEAQWPVYGRLGEMELKDLEDGVSWLKRQPYVDASHIVLSGWSYGGFMTTYALTHSTSWSAGIAGGPVTDWRDYDTIYTERYMKLPSNNADEYRKTAPRFAAERLHGRLLLLHGTMDDNVHLQNTLQFVYELERAGKPFEMMLYPRSRHGVSDPQLNLHLRRLMFDFVMRAIKEEPPP
jgi:dipeptidyl-peptidase-4